MVQLSLMDIAGYQGIYRTYSRNPLELLEALYIYIYIMYNINFLAVADMSLNIAKTKATLNQ